MIFLFVIEVFAFYGYHRTVLSGGYINTHQVSWKSEVFLSVFVYYHKVLSSDGAQVISVITQELYYCDNDY